MRGRTSKVSLKVTLLILPLAALPAASTCYAQQDQPPQSQQPATPAQQQPQPQQPAKTQPPPAPPASPDDSSQESSSKKVLPPDDDSTKKDKAHAAKPGVLPPEDDPAWDPFHAQQDIDVGTFYLHKGDTDAAISRFEDAIRLRANFAKPRLLLAEAYEKKGDNSEAVHYYKEYLKVLPNAPDAKKVQKKIEKLSAEK
ncbi:MAG: tetratricopeptide repeat protein [Candidatus Acidiferrales bacterium]